MTLRTPTINAAEDQESMNLLYRQSGSPMEDRSQTVVAMRELCGRRSNDDGDTPLESDKQPPLSNVYGNGPLVLSDIPESCKNQEGGVVLGIDEAGRGTCVTPDLASLRSSCR